MMVPLVACSMREYRPKLGVPVPVCAAAEDFPYGRRSYPLPLLYPGTELDHTKFDVAATNRAYGERLGRLTTAQVRAELEGIHQAAYTDHLKLPYQDQRTIGMVDRLVLVCTCWLGNPTTKCHRSLIGAWWKARTTDPVPELGDLPLALPLALPI